MASWRRALLYGFLVWLIPFVVALAASPLKESRRPLFESVMAVTLAATVVPLTVLYFRRVRVGRLGEGIRLGLLGLVISVAIDLPLMLSPPVNYTLAEYAADVGLTYLMMPVLTAGIAVAGKGTGV